MRRGLTFLALLTALTSAGAVSAGSTEHAAEATGGLRFAPARPLLQVATSDPFAMLGTADFNGDGLTDVVVARYPADYRQGTSAPLGILLNNGRGGFADATKATFIGHVPETEHPRKILIADFNGDGRPDIFIADHGYDVPPWPGFQNTLVLSAPDGKLVDATANLPPASDFSHSACAADVDGNGTTDLYVGNIGGGDGTPPRILLNDGSGHFRVGQGLLPREQTDITLKRYTACLFVDVNGDGKPDLVLGGEDHTANSAVLLNDGTGHFHLLPDALPGKFLGEIVLDIGSLDINGDGHPDLVFVYTKGSYTGRWLQVLVNHGDGTFRDETVARLPQQPSDGSDGNWIRFIQVEDVNGDGCPDITTETDVWPDNSRDETQPIYLNDCSGHFAAIPDAAAPRLQPGLYRFLDIDGDGGHDLFMAAPANPSTPERYYIARDLAAPVATLYATVPTNGRVTLSTPAAAVTTVSHGRYHIVVNDLSSRNGFHLRGPDVKRATSAAYVGRAVWSMTLEPGVYRYWSDKQPRLIKTLAVR
jgi:FG-GAP-like repeat